jgi:replication-associated recombination protein RarA
MNMVNQSEALNTLTVLAKNYQHGIVISGTSGSGKTYLAREYAKLLNVETFYLVSPSMSDVRSVIDMCTDATNDIVLCVENLDNGVLQVAYPLLKFIEDCPKNLYIVITCFNIRQIPDTILSRCALVNINNPISADLDQYARSVNNAEFTRLKSLPIWQCAKSFSDVDTIMKLDSEALAYFDNLQSSLDMKSPVSSIAWKLQYFENKTPTPLVLVIRYLMHFVVSPSHTRSCIDCLNALATSRISQNAIITKLVFDLKYLE